MKLLISIFVQSPATSFLIGLNILLRDLFSNTLNPCFSFSVRDQVPHPYKTTCKIIVLCILIYDILDRRREDKKL
jgi:hypothetical protein